MEYVGIFVIYTVNIEKNYKVENHVDFNSYLLVSKTGKVGIMLESVSGKTSQFFCLWTGTFSL